ncbi:hypothetical protein SBV1_1090002 [Verrucomicrobia bacterium]|nr:hypothetical protein SBV1_1090002 [Verrucomicrobiota bacterium]
MQTLQDANRIVGEVTQTPSDLGTVAPLEPRLETSPGKTPLAGPRPTVARQWQYLPPIEPHSHWGINE